MSWQAFCREEAYEGNDWQPIGQPFEDPAEAQAFAIHHHEETGHTTTTFKVDD